MPRHPKITRALFAVAAILPPCFAAALIFRYGVDLPYSDEWELAPMLLAWIEGRPSFGDLFAPIQGHRQFFPNLIILALARLTRWDARYEMAVCFLLACLTSFNVYRLGRLTLGEDPRRPAAFLLANLLIFSPAQDVNWLMGQQLIFFVPSACVTTCLVIALSGLGPRSRLALCACLSTVSTFSSANGIVCWLAVFPALVRPGAGGARAGRAAALVWWGCFAANAALYLRGFQTSPSTPPLTAPLLDPARGVVFFISLLGSPLAGQRTSMIFVAAGAGAALLAIYAASCLRLLRQRDGGLTPRGLPVWAGLGAYSILTAGIVTVGRAGLGIEQALASRYTTFTLYLAVACVHLAVLAGRGPAREGRVARGVFAATPMRAAAAALLCLCLGAAFRGFRDIRTRRMMLLREKACLMFTDVVGAGCLTGIVYEDPQVLLRSVKLLLAAGCLPPELARGSDVRGFAAGLNSPPGESGSFEVLVKEGETYTAAGRATLARRKPPDAVLLAYEDAAGGPVVFALADLEDAIEVLGRFPKLMARPELSWRKSFSWGELSAPDATLSAWAFDAETGQAFKLEGTHRLGGAPAPRRAE